MINCSTFRKIQTVDEFSAADGQLACSVIQGVDFREAAIEWEEVDLQGTMFLGCLFPEALRVSRMIANGALIFPKISGLPYDPYRSSLYSREELSKGWTSEDDQSVDKQIYDHFVTTNRHHPPLLESLARSLHDHSIDEALADLLNGKTEPGGIKQVVGVMGGHATSRRDQFYKEVVLLAWQLTREGYFIASGGGPGIMEAANLGAYLAKQTLEEVEECLKILRAAPVYTDPGYVEAAREVLARYPEGSSSVAVPTWFYGHEPSNLFSIHIAKYFSNSIREDGLLAVATYGVVYAPGSAGTTQEIFMDAAQNHYGSLGSISPMVFLGEERYTKESQLWPTIQKLAEGQEYGEMIALTDTATDSAKFIKAHPPVIKG